MAGAGPAGEEWLHFFKARLTSGQAGVPLCFPSDEDDELDVHDEHIAFGGNNKDYDDDDNVESSESEELDREPIQWFRHRSPQVTLNWFVDEGAGPAGNF